MIRLMIVTIRKVMGIAMTGDWFNIARDAVIRGKGQSETLSKGNDGKLSTHFESKHTIVKVHVLNS